MKDTGPPSAQGTDGVGDGIPDFSAARRHVLAEVVRFVRDLRRRDVAVAPNATLTVGRSLAVVGLDDRRRVAAACRAAMVANLADRDAFDDAFPTFWRRLRAGLEGLAVAADAETTATARQRAVTIADEAAAPATVPSFEPAEPPSTSGAPGEGPVEFRLRTGRREASPDRPRAAETDPIRRYSPVGRSQSIDVEGGGLSRADHRRIERFVEALASRPGRRDRPAERGRRIDVGRALRASLETGGTPVELPERAAIRSTLRCCLLVDVSGSVLDTVDRATLLSVVAALQGAARHARTFLFDTALTEVTDLITGPDGDPGEALREAAVSWGGGTQLGAALCGVRDRAPEAVDRRTVVVVVSDGLDVGDDVVLERGITWLGRRARAIVWLNPLAVSPRYEPTAAGMATCLPFVDGLFGFVGPTDLAEAATQIERRGLAGPVGVESSNMRRAEVSG